MLNTVSLHYNYVNKHYTYSRISIIQISIIWTLEYPNAILVWNPKRQFDFLQNQIIINGKLVWFLHLLDLLYHSTVDRKDILADAILSDTHTFN